VCLAASRSRLAFRMVALRWEGAPGPLSERLGWHQIRDAVGAGSPEQLAQVVAGAEQQPLGGDCLLAAEQQVPGASEDGHLPEHRFHDHLASGVGGPACLWSASSVPSVPWPSPWRDASSFRPTLREPYALLTRAPRWLNDRSAGWRRRPATARQLASLDSRGIPARPDMAAGEAATLRDVASASRALAPATPRQLWRLREMGIPVKPGLTKREASALIDRGARRKPT
jgi:hypothetical protein